MFRIHRFVNRLVLAQMTSLQAIFQWVGSHIKRDTLDINKVQITKWNNVKHILGDSNLARFHIVKN